MSTGRPVRPARVRRITPVAQYGKKTTFEERIADLESKKKTIEDKIQRMKDCKEVYENLPFREGEAAFHATHGNVLIRSIEFGAAETDFEDIKYGVVTLSGGYQKVSYKEVLPITEATKSLYGNSKVRNE